MTVDTPASMPVGFRIGIDIGGTSTRAGLLGAYGTNIIEQVKLPSGHGPDGVLKVAQTAVDLLLASTQISIDQVDRIGVGCPGTVDPQTRTVRHAVNLGISDVPMELSELSLTDRVMVNVENDVNAAALGAAQLIGERSRSLVYVNVGTGIAAGFVLGGRIFRGDTGSAGEIGHIVIRHDGPVCGCGQHGCIEALCSGSAIAARWPVIEDSAAKALAEAVAEGDSDAQAVWLDVIDGLAALVQIVVLTYDPQHLVLGGGVLDSSPMLPSSLRARIAERTGPSAFLKSLGMIERLVFAPEAWPVGVLGAAFIGEPLAT